MVKSIQVPGSEFRVTDYDVCIRATSRSFAVQNPEFLQKVTKETKSRCYCPGPSFPSLPSVKSEWMFGFGCGFAALCNLRFKTYPCAFASFVCFVGQNPSFRVPGFEFEIPTASFAIIRVIRGQPPDTPASPVSSSPSYRDLLRVFGARSGRFRFHGPRPGAASRPLAPGFSERPVPPRS